MKLPACFRDRRAPSDTRGVGFRCISVRVFSWDVGLCIGVGFGELFVTRITRPKVPKNTGFDSDRGNLDHTHASQVDL